MQVGVKSSPDSFSAIAFILSKYRIVSSEFEEIMKLIDKEILFHQLKILLFSSF